MLDLAKGLPTSTQKSPLNLVATELDHLAAPRLTVTVRLAQWTSVVTMLWSFQYCSV